MSYTAGVNNDQVRLLDRMDHMESEPLEKFSNLLAFVLVDFAAKGIYGKSRHYMI